MVTLKMYSRVVTGTNRITKLGKGANTKAKEIKIKANMKANELLVIQKLKPAIQKAVVSKIFPAMEKDMKARLRLMRDGAFGRKAFISRHPDGVYNTFQYTPKGSTKNVNSLFFLNYSTHAPSIIRGVKPTNKPTYVGDWVDAIARTGKMESKNIHKNKDGSWPKFVSGVGSMKGKSSGRNKRIIGQTKSALKKLESMRSFHGKTQRKNFLKKKLKKMEAATQKNVVNAKWTALQSGKSLRNFWTPSIKKYWGHIPSLPPTVINDNSSGGSEAVKEMTDSMVRQIKKNIKNIKGKKKPTGR